MTGVVGDNAPSAALSLAPSAGDRSYQRQAARQHVERDREDQQRENRRQRPLVTGEQSSRTCTRQPSGQPSRDENASEGRRGRHVAGVAERHDGKRTTRVE